MKILMVCLGNICRSPLAHGVMEHLVQQKALSWEVDSAGTGDWHVGEAPDKRSQQVAKKHGVDISTQKARQISVLDIEYYDVLFVMDEENLRNVRALTDDVSLHQKIRLLDAPNIVPDPYFDDSMFEPVYQQIRQACVRFLEEAQ